ncbi:hypothetical protein [Candidatus Nitrosocosmicus sp. T]
MNITTSAAMSVTILNNTEESVVKKAIYENNFFDLPSRVAIDEFYLLDTSLQELTVNINNGKIHSIQRSSPSESTFNNIISIMNVIVNLVCSKIDKPIKV